jgi:hypothetical protein
LQVDAGRGNVAHDVKAGVAGVARAICMASPERQRKGISALMIALPPKKVSFASKV